MTLITARPRAFGTASVFIALLLLTACGGGGDGGGVASAGGEANPGAEDTEDAAPLDEDAQALVFAECMRDNGIDMPDPGPGPQGLGSAFQEVAGDYDSDAIQDAISACQDLMPQYASGEQHGDDEWMLELAECLRDQGLEVSDDPFAEAHAGKIDVNEFSAAMEVCRDVLTGGGE